MGAAASAEMSADQLKEKYAEVKHRLYPNQQAEAEELMEKEASTLEIMEYVNKALNDPEVPAADYSSLPKFGPKHKSLMCKVLTEEMFEELKDKKTAKGYTLSQAIQTGTMTPHLGVGCTAGDEESWTTFKALYYPVIKGWHNFDPETQNHRSDLDPEQLQMTDAQVEMFNEYVVSTRIRAARNISGFALPAGTDDADRKGVRETLCRAFAQFEGELAGKYYDLATLTDEDRDALLKEGYLFQIPKTTNLLWHAGAAKSWPADRGIFHNEAHTALCWVNEEDHCRIISMEKGGNCKSVFARFCDISAALKKSAEADGTKLMYSEKLGYLGTCPSNLGTGLRASVMIRLPKFNESEEARVLLDKVCSTFDLQPRGSAGEHSAAVEDKFDVSNKQRIGFTEVELVQKMIDGVTKVITFEKGLQDGTTSLADVAASLDTKSAAPADKRKSSVTAARKASVGASASPEKRRSSASAAAAADSAAAPRRKSSVSPGPEKRRSSASPAPEKRKSSVSSPTTAERKPSVPVQEHRKSSTGTLAAAAASHEHRKSSTKGDAAA